MSDPSHEPTVAVVGLGFGRSHIVDALRLTGKARLAAIVDVVAPRENPRYLPGDERDAVYATPHFASLDELFLHDVPDIVAIATPIHTHTEMARTALAAGAHVLLEKPPTATLAEHAELTRLAEAAGRAVQVGFQARGSTALPAVRAMIDDGAIGDVRGIGAVGRWVRDRAYYERARWAGHRELEGTIVMDGAMTNPFAHAVDAALAIDGCLTAEDVLDVEIDAWHAHPIDTDDTSSLVASTVNGTRVAAALTLCAADEVESPVITVHGTAGALRLHYTADLLEIVAADGSVRTETYTRTSMLENLIDHLRDGVPLHSPLASTGAFMRVLEEIRTGPAARAIPAEFVRWTGEGTAARPIVADVGEWCERAAAAGRTFTAAGAPWTDAAG